MTTRREPNSVQKKNVEDASDVALHFPGKQQCLPISKQSLGWITVHIALLYRFCDLHVNNVEWKVVSYFCDWMFAWMILWLNVLFPMLWKLLVCFKRIPHRESFCAFSIITKLNALFCVCVFCCCQWNMLLNQLHVCTYRLVLVNTRHQISSVSKNRFSFGLIKRTICWKYINSCYPTSYFGLGTEFHLFTILNS